MEKIKIKKCEKCEHCEHIEYLKDIALVFCKKKGNVWIKNENFESYEEKECEEQK